MSAMNTREAAMQSTVLILGGRGRFGLAAARAFASAGWRVLAQVRPGAPAPMDAGIEWLLMDLSDGAALAQAAQGSAVVLHAVNPPYPQWEQQALPALEQAIALAVRLRARLMLPGNVYNFGSDMPAVLREDTPQNADTRKGLIRVAMEQRLRQASQREGLHSIVLRAGNFFGNGRGSWFDLSLAKNIARGTLTYPGAGNVATAWAYLPDLAMAFERVASRALIDPACFESFEVFHFKGYSLSAADWMAALTPLAREQGWLKGLGPLKRGAMPWWLFRSLGWAVPMLRELAEMQYLWHTPHTLANDKLTGLIGAEPHTPLALAAKAALADLGLLSRGPADAAA
jgi:nucleoside-diphosphate-sugar epimerase